MCKEIFVGGFFVMEDFIVDCKVWNKDLLV